MGDGFAARSFVHTFAPVVEEWQDRQRGWGPYVDQLVVRSPLGGEVDLSLTKCADDLTKKLIGGR
eukprot:6724480-Pyramimonas_sp.AAC.1